MTGPEDENEAADAEDIFTSDAAGEANTSSDEDLPPSTGGEG